ncbi:3'-5' exonuclease [Helicobacter cappadocius]|uniref:3'-5' exonuclease n=1 Tax=Helicobacter cappadocius TaxID=3063998 RepID=A0AA90PIC5_9HELI|nr:MULTISPECIES: 3'-5' exonuclease [unclassified Helicobacter]MDO7252499.1 3'-5' exonuclease [Helicobacter sp. faydin-H75]MDP2538366.1 3'-5' exonuclease [Helicobacter sp. faydin-H76]
MSKMDFLEGISSIWGISGDVDEEIQTLKSRGFPISEQDESIFLDTIKTKLQNQVFCFVDIETTGSKPEEYSIIEIGALKYQNGNIIDKFESFVHVEDIPEKITELTGISTQTVQNSPCLSSVLRDFRIFLNDCVFVAHNVNFDYGFISYQMEKIGLGAMLNVKLCTIDLAHKTILSPRYSLPFLNEFLGINTPISHRAYADALTSLRVFETSLLCIPKWINNTQDLLDFSKGKK